MKKIQAINKQFWLNAYEIDDLEEDVQNEVIAEHKKFMAGLVEDVSDTNVRNNLIINDYLFTKKGKLLPVNNYVDKKGKLVSTSFDFFDEIHEVIITKIFTEAEQYCHDYGVVQAKETIKHGDFSDWAVESIDSINDDSKYREEFHEILENKKQYADFSNFASWINKHGEFESEHLWGIFDDAVECTLNEHLEGLNANLH